MDGLVENWQGIVLEEGGVYKAVFPVPIRRKFGLKYVYPPFFIQQLGLFTTVEKFNNLERETIKILQKHFKFIELNLNWKSEIGEPLTNLILNLGGDYDTLQSSFSNNHKRNLKKSDALNLSLGTPTCQEVILLFQEGRGATLATFKEKDYERFKAVIDLAVKKRNAFIRGVYKNNTLLSGAVFLKFKNRIIFLFSGTSEEGKKCGALFNLINSVIKDYEKSGFILDFEGSQNEGLARFYEGFGAVNEPYRFLKINKLPKILRRIKS